MIFHLTEYWNNLYVEDWHPSSHLQSRSAKAESFTESSLLAHCLLQFSFRIPSSSFLDLVQRLCRAPAGNRFAILPIRPPLSLAFLISSARRSSWEGSCSLFVHLWFPYYLHVTCFPLVGSLRECEDWACWVPAVAFYLFKSLGYPNLLKGSCCRGAWV